MRGLDRLGRAMTNRMDQGLEEDGQAGAGSGYKDGLAWIGNEK